MAHALTGFRHGTFAAQHRCKDFVKDSAGGWCAMQAKLTVTQIAPEKKRPRGQYATGAVEILAAQCGACYPVTFAAKRLLCARF
jgi:hypothetical protein